MSRIGKMPISLPSGVKIEQAGQLIRAQGSKGSAELTLLPGIEVELTDSTLQVKKVKENAETQKQFGLMRTLLANMVKGVAEGYERRLEIQGVGYRASVAGSSLNLSLGFSHPVEYQLPQGVEARVERNSIIISGIDKQQVGQVAADIRSFRKPEPYKGKGIRYDNEVVRRKAGKAATKG